MPISSEATKELLASARHYSGMRFGMMGVFIVLSALLVRALFPERVTVDEVGDQASIAFFGILASIWFFMFECLLSYNLLKLWGKIQSDGKEEFQNIWPHRTDWAVWFARLVLPVPYLLAFGYWLNQFPVQWFPGLFWVVPVIVWLLMWVFFAMAEKRAHPRG